MSGLSLALAAALHFDTDLASDPRPFAEVVGALTAGQETRDLQQWTITTENYAPPPSPFALDTLIKLVARGKTSTAAVETSPHVGDRDRMMVAAGTTPSAQRPERFVQTRCRYDFKSSIGSNRLASIGAQHVLDAIVRFADEVAVRAGVVYWAETTDFAASLASLAERDQLTQAQRDHISSLMYWRPRWGEVIRGPAWGTFLGASHVEKLGGVARIENESGAIVIPLRSGGAFLQATPIEAPLLEGRDDATELAAYLAPVMGRA